jgi:broad specificity phosphatase PhoE
MSVKITYFVHGTTTDNEKHISSGWKDVELSELGVKQGIELKEQTKDMHFDVVFCSDLQRAYKSALLTWEGMYEIIQDPRLRECNYGDLNGASSDIVEPLQEKEMLHKPFPNGESYDDVKTRIADFLKFLKENYDGKHVAVVGHKAPQLSLEVLTKGLTWEEALANDWRKKKAWQPGWEYTVE